MSPDTQPAPISTAKVVVGTITGLAGLTVALNAFGVFGSWADKTAETYSAGNVQKQYTEVIGDYNAMIVAADNVCQYTQTQHSSSPTDAQVLEDPMQAYTATYRSDVQKYDDAMQNIFEAKLVGPHGYPKPELVDNISLKNWCNVSTELKKLRSNS